MDESGACPLEGVKVVEMDSLLGGPFCGQHNGEVYGGLLHSGEEERTCPRERGIF